MDENKKMISLHEQKFPDLDVFQVNTSARLKNIEAQIGHFVQAFKEKFSRTSPSNTFPNPNLWKKVKMSWKLRTRHS